MTSSAERTDLVIIGAGPAGLAAAVQAARSGLRTMLIDAGAHFGGQYWRHGPAGITADVDLHHDVQVYIGLATQAEHLIDQGRIAYLPEHHVWNLAVDAAGCTVHTVSRADPAQPTELTVYSDYLILAAGAYDRQVPFPGWDLPGVITVGAAQSLLKGSGVVVGRRVVVAGTGPFLLPVAAGLATRGSTVIGVHEANHPIGWLRHLPALVGQSRKLGEATAYTVTLAGHRVRIRHRSIVVAAHGTDQLEAVTVGRLGRTGVLRAATLKRISVDVLAVGYGFIPQPELALAAGCAVHTTADQTLAVTIDARQATTNPRVFAAGEITGVGGAQLAVAEGILAGAAAAQAARSPVYGSPQRLLHVAARRDRLRRFASAMHAVYPVPAVWMDHLEPDTIVCRCEEVTVADITRAVDLGARDARTVKLLSRCGMGWCQGRECGYAASCLLARRTGQDPDLVSGAGRPIATPIPLGIVARMAQLPPDPSAS
jgi:NADPH-dependent 2,4-dienoyl-CoA reductase/sulfur reductase-like enzyme